MTGFLKRIYPLYAAAAGLTPAATRQFGPEFGNEHPLDLSVLVAPNIEERNELLGYVTPIHVEGE